MKKWRCTVCGEIFEGEHPPVPCPVCGAGESAFELLEDSGPAQWQCTVCGQIFDGIAPPVPCPVCGAGESAFIKIQVEETLFRQDTDDKFVLVGGGVAALEAAKAIRKRNKTASITMLIEENHLPYNRPALSDVVADDISFHNLLLEEAEFYKEMEISMQLGVKAEALHCEDKTVSLANGTKIPYTKLLLATGSNPFNPIKRDVDSIPLHVLRTYEDAQALVKNAKGKRIVLVGGGILGLEQAVALRERGCHITIVEFSSRILPLQADEEASCRLTKRLESLGMHVITGNSVVSAGPHGVTLNDGKELAADIVLASMGIRSEVTLAKGCGLTISKGIVVNDYMHTSSPDIWAAGDCAEFNGRVMAMVGSASAMGAVAGASMAGEEDGAYHPFTPATAFECPGFSMFSVGVVFDGASETITYENQYSKNYKRLFLNKNQLTGALFVGDNAGAKAVKAVETNAKLEDALSLLL